MFVVSGAFATGVSSTATTADCDKPTLNTYSGTSNLQAGWEPNPIALHWYSDGEELNNIPTESQSCIYDSTLTPPTTIPTKTGYTFKGWRVRPPVCSFTASEVNGMSNVDYGYKGDSTGAYGASGRNASRYGLTTDNSWAVEFRTGIIKGMAKCSNTNGGRGGTLGTPSDTNGQYCWCRATNYTPSGGSACNVSSSSWVFSSDRGSVDSCADYCASNCAGDVRYGGGFRRAVFGVQ